MTVQQAIDELNKVQKKSTKLMVEKINEGIEEVYEGDISVTLFLKSVSTIYVDGTITQ